MAFIQDIICGAAGNNVELHFPPILNSLQTLLYPPPAATHNQARGSVWALSKFPAGSHLQMNNILCKFLFQETSEVGV